MKLQSIQSKWCAVALAIACGLTAVGPVSAQTISLSGIDVSSQGGYGNWGAAIYNSGLSVGSAGTAGVQVIAPGGGGFGGTYLDLGAGATLINANSTRVTLTFTVNGTAANYNWIGVPLDLNDGTGTGSYGGVYSGSGNPGNPPNAVWTGNTASITYSLSPAQIAFIQAGTDVVYGFNVGVDQAVVTASPMDITFNSLTFSPAPVPEPATFALLGLGVSGLLVFRRRK